MIVLNDVSSAIVQLPPDMIKVALLVSTTIVKRKPDEWKDLKQCWKQKKRHNVTYSAGL